MNLLLKFIRLGFISAILAPFAGYATTLVPISVGDILIIIPINDAPVASDDSLTVDEDTPINLPILANDEDENLAAINAICSQTVTANCVAISNFIPSNGSATIDAGIVSIQLPEHWNGTASFTYQLIDEKGKASNIATATIVVTPVNDAPVALGETDATTGKYVVISGRTTALDLTTNDFDPDGDSFEIFYAILPQDNGRITLQLSANKQKLLVTTTTDGTFTTTIDYELIDEHGARSETVSAIVASEGSEEEAPVTQPISTIIPRTALCNENMRDRLIDIIADGCVFTIDSLQNISAPQSTPEQLVLSDLLDVNDIRLSGLHFQDGRRFSESDYGYSQIVGNDILYIPSPGFYQQLLTNPTARVDRYKYVIEDQLNREAVSYVNIFGNATTNMPPTITSVTPQSGTEYSTEDTVVVEVQATDDNSVEKVRARLNGGMWEDDLEAPYSFDFGRLAVGSYQIEVQVVDDFNDVSALEQIGIQVEAAPPDFPLGVSATAVDSSVSLTWNSVTNVERYEVEVSYRLNASSVWEVSGTSVTVTHPTTTHTWTSLADGEYRYRVRSCLSSTCSVFSSFSNTVLVNQAANDVFTSSVSSIRVGQPIALTWSVSNASSCSISIGGNVIESGLRGEATDHTLTPYLTGDDLAVTLDCVDSDQQPITPSLTTTLTIQKLSAPTLNPPVVQ